MLVRLHDLGLAVKLIQIADVMCASSQAHLGDIRSKGEVKLFTTMAAQTNRNGRCKEHLGAEPKCGPFYQGHSHTIASKSLRRRF